MPKAGGHGIRIGIKRRMVCAAAARPESRAANLMRIGVAHHARCDSGNLARKDRGAAAGKARNCEVEASPEEMHGTAFADESRAELLHHTVGLQQHLPKAPGVLGIVCRMRVVAVEIDCRLDLAGPRVDRDRNTEIIERRHYRAVEVGDALRLQGETPRAGIAADVEPMPDEIELDLESARAVRDRRGGQSGGGNVQRHVPAVIQPRRSHKTNFADDLRPKMQGVAGIAPRPVVEVRPEWGHWIILHRFAARCCCFRMPLNKMSQGNGSCARAALQRFWSSRAGWLPAPRRMPAGGPRRWTRRRRRDSPAWRSNVCTRSIPITSAIRWTATQMRVPHMGSPPRSMAASTGTPRCTATGCWCACCV